MHFASAAATLWCPRSPSVRLYLTFISLSVSLSTCSGPLGGGGALRLFICSFSTANPVRRQIVYTLNRILHLTGYYMLSLSCVCVEAFPLELAKIPALSQKVPLAEEHHRWGGTLGRTCDQTPSSADGRSLEFTFLQFSHHSLCLPAQERDQSSPEVASLLFCCLSIPVFYFAPHVGMDTPLCVSDCVCTEGFH